MKFHKLTILDYENDLKKLDAVNIPRERANTLRNRAIRGLLLFQGFSSSRWVNYILQPRFSLETDKALMVVVAKSRAHLVNLGVAVEEDSKNASAEYAFLQALWKKGAERFARHIYEVGERM